MATGPVTWKITSVTPATGLTAQGTPAKGSNVAYQLSDGGGGTVFVADSESVPAQVEAAVQAHATNLVAIKGLTGTVQVM